MALRTAILYSGSQIGNAFGGLFAIAILKLEGAHGLDGWRWLFIVEGIMSESSMRNRLHESISLTLPAVGLGAIFAFIIPNRPQTIRWLTSQERDQLNYRLEVDRSSKDGTDEVSVGKAFMMAITDVKTWLLCGCLQMNYVSIWSLCFGTPTTRLPMRALILSDRCVCHQFFPDRRGWSQLFKDHHFGHHW
jgi:hypothetical protein